MPNFNYSARDRKGALFTSSVEAVDRQEAAKIVMDRGLTPVSVVEEKKKFSNPLSNFIKKYRKIPTMEKVVFARQFATMIGAGLPIAQALHILDKQTANDKMRGIISDISKQVEGGQSLSHALGRYPDVFGSIFINMVRAGEVGGILDEVLERLATQLEKEHELSSKIKGAMIYPIVIAIAMVIVFVVMMVVVIPRISSLFLESGIELPLPTKILIGISQAFTTFPYNVVVVAGIIAGIISLKRFKKTSKGKRVFDRFALKLPIAGPLIKKIAYARFSRTLGSLLSSGIAVLDSIEVVSGAVGNSVFADEMDNISKQVKNGVPMNQPLKQSKVFPPLVGQMIAVGEETGTLDKILTRLAVFYESEVDRIVNGLSTIMEPVLILIMGTAVAFLVIALILPILRLSQAF